MKKILVCLLTLIFFLSSYSQELRNPYLWPFSKTSIWNMPIGSAAEYTPQPVNPNHIDGIMVDADIIIITPDNRTMPVYGTEYCWTTETNRTTRCIKYNDKVHIRLPIPANYITTFYGSRPNNPGVIVTSNGRSLVQTQPFQTCGDDYATTGIRKSDPNDILRYEDIDILAEGIEGMHGGSGLSSLGGAIRVGELAPGSEPMRHALKISFPGEYYLFFDHTRNKGYRWPARKHDTNAESAYNGDNPEALQGCLRAIPAWIDVDTLGLETEPGKKLAWTLQNYGAYQVEGVPWARMMIAVEDGPAGDVAANFKKDWGYDMVTLNKSNPWFRDMIRIMDLLHVISNNGPDSIGGGGEPIQPLAPDFIPFGRLEVKTDGTPDAEIYPLGSLYRLEGHEYVVNVTSIPNGHSFSHWRVTYGDPIVEDSLSYELHLWLTDYEAGVEAVFVPNTFNLVTVISGNGSVVLSPEQEQYTYGTSVELFADPDSLWTFSGWSGNISSIDNPLEIIINEDTYIDVLFEALNTLIPEESQKDQKAVRMLFDSNLQCLIIIIPQEIRAQQISIYAINGSQIKTLQIQKSGENRFPVGDLRAGTYLSRIDVENGQQETFKFVIL